MITANSVRRSLPGVLSLCLLFLQTGRADDVQAPAAKDVKAAISNQKSPSSATSMLAIPYSLFIRLRRQIDCGGLGPRNQYPR